MFKILFVRKLPVDLMHEIPFRNQIFLLKIYFQSNPKMALTVDDWLSAMLKSDSPKNLKIENSRQKIQTRNVWVPPFQQNLVRKSRIIEPEDNRSLQMIFDLKKIILK